jgi:signal transduction histidine kinase/purine-cytosine permease-like protein
MLRVKREYQSWVANESLEDYALRYAASSYRRWSPGVVANTALGGISFLALEAIGASVTLSYGFQNAMVALLAVTVLIFLVSLPIAYWCSVANVDIDLLTRGAGFGYIGSTITSLIYASFTFIFFAIETAIWAQALTLATGLDLALGYLICSLVIIPIVFYGVTSINKLQAWTQPIWIAMLVVPLIVIVVQDPGLLRTWASHVGAEEVRPGFDLLLFGAASGVLFSLVAQIGEQADYLRFLPEKNAANRRAWWAAMLSAGPGWIVLGALKVAAGSLLAVLALSMGSSAAQAVEPAHMFAHAYRRVVEDPALALLLTTIFVSISQLKINVTNAYSGSLAWSNCFVRLAHYHPGRVVWLVFNVVIALLLSLLGIFETLQVVLSVYSTVAIAWIGALVADLVVLKRVGLSPPYIEFKRAHLYNFNPVGCGATGIAALVAILAYAGVFGVVARAFFGFIALGLAFVVAIAIAYATRGRYYIARRDEHYRDMPAKTLVNCCICQREYEAPDMAHCPFYSGPICSLCCGLELHCHDRCKQPLAKVSAVEAEGLASRGMHPRMLRRIGRFFGILSVTAALLGAAFLATYRLMELDDLAHAGEFVRVLVRLYVGTLVVTSLGIWWIVLSHESREQAEHELLESMQHREQMRRDLVQSDKLASLGGLVAGVAHEINTPVGVVVSTASYLTDRTQAVRESRSAGAWDASSQRQYLDDATEASRLLLSNAQRVALLVRNFRQLAIDRVSEEPRRFELHALIDDVVGSLKPRIDEAGAVVSIEVPADLWMQSYPVALAQVVTNLTINSLQHAFVADQPGGTIRWRASIGDDDELRIEYTDDGRGIDPALHRRVFEPFFTTRRTLGGTGLGLYLVNQIVTRQLGGTITLEPRASGVRFDIVCPRVARHVPDLGLSLVSPPQRSVRDA